MTTQRFRSICYIFLHLRMKIAMIYLYTKQFKNSSEKKKYIYSKKVFQTCGNVHSQGKTVINTDGHSNCLTASTNINGPIANNQQKIL